MTRLDAEHDRPCRVLLLGPGGQLGHELGRALAALGPVTAAGRDRVDLAEPDSIHETIADLRPDLVVNAAGYTAVDDAEGEPELAMAVNADACRHLAVAATRVGAGLVHYSTDYVFDGSMHRPLRPTDPVRPLGAYGRSKLAGERAVAEHATRALILRTSWVYSSRRRNFLRSILGRGLAGEALRVVDDQVGTPTSARCIAETTAAVLAQARGIAAPPFRDGVLVEHLACRGSTTWHGFAVAILELAGLHAASVEPITTADYPAAARRPAWSVLDATGLERRFGVDLPPWRDELARILRDDAAVLGLGAGAPLEESP